MTVWLMVGAVGLLTALTKAAGPALLGGRRLPVPVRETLALLSPALLAALVATQVFATGSRWVFDDRAAGVAVAAVALLMRAPLLLAVVLAAMVTAALRALGG